MRGGATAAEHWLPKPSTAVITYNDLMPIEFIHTVMAAGRSVPRDVNVIGLVNIVDSPLVEPQLTTIASPLISLGSAAVAHHVRRSGRQQSPSDEPVVLPARLMVRGSNSVRQQGGGT